MTNFDYYNEEMIVALMTGGRCKFIMDHSGGECQNRTWTDTPVCEKCAARFKTWLSMEHDEEPPNTDHGNKLRTEEALKRIWDRFNRKL